MLVIEGLEKLEVSGWSDPCAVTIGNFDGCHLGHQKLIADAVAHGRSLALPSVVITFNPRPEAFFCGKPDEVLLFNRGQKNRAFKELGLDCHVVQPFTDRFSRTTHEDFYTNFIRARLQARAVVVGSNFRFGLNRRGNPEYLAAHLQADGGRITVNESVVIDDVPISSTRIRVALKEMGRVEKAASMLGRPFLIDGEIVKGNQLGRKLGFPTANLAESIQIIPAYGVYAGYVWLGDSGGKRLAPVMKMPADTYPAVFNIGRRPTVKSSNPRVQIEAHLLTGEFGMDSLYGVDAGYYLTHRIRPERAFDGIEQLKAQIGKDSDKAKHLLGLI